MRTFLSSIFSFRTLAISDVRGSGACQTVVLAVCLIVAAEAVTRRALAPIGGYWEYWTPRAAVKFERYRADLVRGVVPPVLVVGDSTAARDVDPEALSAALNIGPAFNLAWPANFPLAFEYSTLPLLRNAVTPDIVVVSFSPLAFFDSPTVRRFEESILSSPYTRRAAGERGVSDFVHLARLRAALPFRKSWWTGTGLPQPSDGGFMPLEGTTGAAEGIEEVGAFGRDRFAVLQDLQGYSRRYGFQLMVVLPPRRDVSQVRRNSEAEYVERLRAAGFQYLDFREAPFLSPEHFHDAGHLNRVGARIYSSRLGEALGRPAAPSQLKAAAG